METMASTWVRVMSFKYQVFILTSHPRQAKTKATKACQMKAGTAYVVFDDATSPSRGELPYSVCLQTRVRAGRVQFFRVLLLETSRQFVLYYFTS